MHYSTVAGADDGLVLQDCNLGLKLVANMTRGGGVTQDETGRDVLVVVQEQTLCMKSRDRLEVRTLRCGRNNPGHVFFLQQQSYKNIQQNRS